MITLPKRGECARDSYKVKVATNRSDRARLPIERMLELGG
jgi:quinolinate synthase